MSSRITRVAPVPVNDMTSGFNIREDISLDLRYIEMLGHSEKGIRDCLQLVCSEMGVPEDEKQTLQTVILSKFVCITMDTDLRRPRLIVFTAPIYA